MTDSDAQASLSRLPGKIYDRASRQLREEVLGEDFDPIVFIEENFSRTLTTRDERFENKIKAYALASVFIDQLWDYLQQKPLADILRDARKRLAPSGYGQTVDYFAEMMLLLLGHFRDAFFQEVQESAKNIGSMSQEQKKLLCYWSVARHRAGEPAKGLPIPSFADLVVFLGRFAQVIPAVCLRDLGWAPSAFEVITLLRRASLLRLCTDIMVNDRQSMHPFMGVLEGNALADLNDLKRRFLPEHFEMFSKDGVISMRLRASAVGDYCDHFAVIAAKRQEAGNPPDRVLGCPALYTGKFREMYTWVCDLFEVWLQA